MSFKYPKGSEWRKWDLHVHTPYSIEQNYGDIEKVWEKFISDLEALPPSFKVIGINDYIFLDGYKRILQERAKGRLKNLDLILPVIEFRVDKFGGTDSALSRVNLHVIFSDQLKPEIIETQFLNRLPTQYVLNPEFDHLGSKWNALPTRASLEDLGHLIIESVPEKERAKFAAPLKEGFNNLCFKFEEIIKIVENTSYFKEKALTAVGKTEWADIKWNDQSIAEKKNIINSVDLVFISSETIADCERAQRVLEASKVNSKLLDCSDAHDFSDAKHKDRIGKCFTWIKADPTFEGLRQVRNEYAARCSIGNMPPKLIRVSQNQTKYIHSIKIEKVEGSQLNETWFSNEIPMNPDMVAIIGNRGKGKSALTDTIGLLGNTYQHEVFSFLSRSNFRNPRDNKAKHFRATLTWESGASITKGLDDAVRLDQPELVKYIPQNFLERVCNQIGGTDETDFDRELRKVIFSHVKEAQRLGKDSLEALIKHKTAEANDRISILKEELHGLNEEIIELEKRLQPEYKSLIEGQLEVKRNELAAHEKSKPAIVPKPEQDSERQGEAAALAAKIEGIKSELKEIETAISEAKSAEAKCAANSATLQKVSDKIENFRREAGTFKRELTTELESLGIKYESLVNVAIDTALLKEKAEVLAKERGDIEQKLDPKREGSLVHKKNRHEESIRELEAKLDEPNRRHQANVTALEEWEKKKLEIVGSEGALGTITYFEKQLAAIAEVPNQLEALKEQRLAKSAEIFSEIDGLARTYREVYAPVQEFIDQNALAKEKLKLNFDVSILDTGFANGFFEQVNQRTAGTFWGEQGERLLKDALERQDFNSAEGVKAFLIEILDCITRDKRPKADNKLVNVENLMKKGHTPLTLYDLLFSLSYLKPRYVLKMGDKELHQLSPGERGTLLLVFYLLVDKDDIPLVIDQPEENLDNQTVYELLVPCIRQAKGRRQIFIVTHNPNLAVVCDAEQVICADLDKTQNYRMDYLPGAIENPEINKKLLDILEGTRPAFDNRDSKYLQ